MSSRSDAVLYALVMCCAVVWAAWIVKSPLRYPNYKEACKPLVYIRAVPEYYNGRVFVVCGSPSTEPVLVEVKPIR